MDRRDSAIDIAKAIGILLMIYGHCPGITGMTRNFIFSFHMPLFFIFSGYFYKPTPMAEVVRKGNRHLVRPYLITSFFVVLLCLTAGNVNLAGEKVIGIIMSNGGWPNEMFGAGLPYIGPIWFLLALYWCKIFYNYLRQHTKKYLLVSFVISTIALIIGQYVVNLPFGILTGFCGMVFYAMGDYWKNEMRGSLKPSVLVVGVLIWGLCIRKAHLELMTFDCTLYPISMFAAFIGTYVTYLVAKWVPEIIKPIMVWIGRHTLLILCYHALTIHMMMNISHYYLEPGEIVLTSDDHLIINFVIGIGLPYLHTIVWKRLAKR